MGKPRLAAIYARVSSEKQGRDNAVSIGEQLADCQKRLAENGDVLAVTYVDDTRYRSSISGRMVEPSAKRTDRPQWTAMLASAGREWTVLYSWRIDRICRGNEAAGMFERVLDERRIDVVIATQQFDRDTFGLMAGGVSSYELRNIAVRTNMGREGRVKAGKHTGRTPYGYRVVRDDAGRSVTYEVTPDGRRFFDQLAALFLERHSLREIGRRLAPSRVGKPWVVKSILHFLTSPFYRGRLLYGADRPEGQRIYNEQAAHAPAWDDATLGAIEAEIARRGNLGRHMPRQSRRVYLFRGVLRCAYCGRPLSTNGGEKGGIYFYNYVCRRQPGEPHPPNGISEKKALALLRSALAELTPERVDAYLDALYAVPAYVPPVVAVQAELDQLEAKETDLAAGLERVQGIAPAVSALIERELAEVRAAIAARRADVARAAVVVAEVSRADLRAAMLDLSANLEHLDAMPRADAARLISRAGALYLQDRRFVTPPATLRANG